MRPLARTSPSDLLDAGRHEAVGDRVSVDQLEQAGQVRGREWADDAVVLSRP